MRKFHILSLKSLLSLLVFSIVISCSSDNFGEAGVLELSTNLHDFGEVLIGESAEADITVTNIGKSGAYIISIGLTNSGSTNSTFDQSYNDFTIESILDCNGTQEEAIEQSEDSYIPLKRNESLTIKTKFSPSTPNLATASLIITNVSLSNNPLVVELIANTQPQDIDVTPNPYDFGQVDLNKPAIKTFTVENKKNTNMFINSVILDSGDIGDFEIELTNFVNNLQPAETTTFDVIYTPTDTTQSMAKIAIMLGEFSSLIYAVTISGTGIEPQMVVLNEQSEIIENESGVFDYSKTPTKIAKKAEFTIKNIGTNKLLLIGSEAISISGVDANLFNVVTNPDTEIDAGNETKFTIEYKPTEVGDFTAVVTIENTDTNDNPYTFTLKGFGFETSFDFNGDGHDDIVIAACNSDAGGSNSGCVYIFFGKSNWDSSINASNADVKIIGDSTDDQFGQSVQSAGDVNNDGIDDLIVGTSVDDDGGGASGCAFIYFGTTTPTTTIRASDADVKLIGEANGNRFGISVSTAGDFNNDGFDDVVVGASEWYNHGNGKSYIFFGSSTMSSTIDASNADVRLYGGNTDDQFGISVSTAGDVNNDGFDDVIVGAYGDDDGGGHSGSVFLFYGSNNPNSTINCANADVIITGGDADDRFGVCVSDAGDFNSDGIDDFVIGAYYDDDGGSNSGSAFVYFGSTSLSPQLDAVDANVKIIGQNVGDNFGFCVNNAGDVNNDGIDDIIVGSNQNDGCETKSGSAYIFLGQTNLSPEIDASDAFIKFKGENTSDNFGRSVSGAGDINEDGLSDIIVGANMDDNGGQDSGCAYIFYSNLSYTSEVNAQNANTILIAENAGDYFGCSVAGGR